MRIVQPVSLLVFLGEIAERARPGEHRVLQFVPLPDRRAQVLRSLLSGDIAHQFDAQHAGGVVTPGLDLGRGSENRHRAAGTSRLVTRGRQAVEFGVNLREQSAKQALLGEHIGDEIAHMSGLDIGRLEPGFFQPARQRLGEAVGNLIAFPRPITRKIALPAADNRDHEPHPLLLDKG